MVDVFKVLVKIIELTPIYVWLLLAFLVQRGISTSQEREVNILKSFLVPGVFIVWGLYNIVAKFAHPFSSILTYLVFLAIGVFLGTMLYQKTYRFFVRNGAVIRAKNYFPLFIILFNFLIKYSLNIYMYMDTDAVNRLSFNMLYTAISGTTVGLFFGGIVITYRYVTTQRGRIRG
ncbi:hypothetical protein M3223_15940 [Paenibacillus pasadenensis]|uniref:hypothetical protein n=1 Tax=Paenibacillus pasadenensis TaxID=217090 RepID=UPI00203D9A9D|nr:hypothetical protein [Paenibacillus pasadenensis]MCM3748845.1 hypothetical protein [Paenibacillus pasadenensis]